MMVSLFSLFVTSCELPATDPRLVAQIQPPVVESTDNEPAAPAEAPIEDEDTE